jgi:hypothetical protein
MLRLLPGKLLPTHLLDSIDRPRDGTDDILSAGTITGTRMGLIEDAVEQLRREHIRDAPHTMLAALLTEFVAVVNLTSSAKRLASASVWRVPLPSWPHWPRTA